MLGVDSRYRVPSGVAAGPANAKLRSARYSKFCMNDSIIEYDMVRCMVMSRPAGLPKDVYW